MKNNEIRKLLGCKPSVDRILKTILEKNETGARIEYWAANEELRTVEEGLYKVLADNLEAEGYKLRSSWTEPFYVIQIIGWNNNDDDIS